MPIINARKKTALHRGLQERFGIISLADEDLRASGGGDFDELFDGLEVSNDIK